jgi:gamma-glutamyltranspeptidase/glutathione hydrolase
MTSRLTMTVAAVVAAFTTALAVPGAGAQALLRPTASGAPYSLSATALLGPTQTDLYLTVTSSGPAAPDELGLVQVKVFAESGELVRTETFHDVASPGGTAQVALKGLERKQVLEVKAHAKDHDQNNIEARATVLLRPDLTVVASAPARVVRTHPFTLTADVTELGGDTGTSATVSLVDGGATVASQPVTVAAGSSTSVAFPRWYETAAKHAFDVVISAAQPAESNVTNNTASTSVNIARYDFDGAASSDIPEATAVGRAILDAGGNAVDAAVAMQFALGVTEPQNAGLGGGSTILLHIEGKGDFAIDARELSPAQTTARQYLEVGTFRAKKNADSSGFAVGVPGSLAADDLLLHRWGTITLSESLQPAIRLAENGFVVGKNLSYVTAPGQRCQVAGQPETKALFCNDAGLAEGSTFVQPDLAKTMRLIAAQGPDVFYRGEIASAIVEAQHRTRVIDGSGVGQMTLDDLASYTVNEDAPLAIKYHGYDLKSVGGSSAGGYVLLQTLKMLDLRRDEWPLGDVGRGFGWLAPDTAQAMAEAARLAFADRSYWLGDDPRVPRDALLSDCYLRPRAAKIRLDSSFPNSPLPIGDPRGCNPAAAAAEVVAPTGEGGGTTTTHFSVLDKWGNAVSFTTTLTSSFGSGILVPGYGFVLNNALSNFFNNAFPAEKPGDFPSPGNPGMNDAAPHKRALGNTAPLIAFKDGEPVLITGSPGGTNIPGVVTNVVINTLDDGMSVQEAVDRPRIWFNFPIVFFNQGVPQETIDHLRALGHTVNGPVSCPPGAACGGAESIAIDPGTFALSVAKDRLIPDATAVLVPPR